MGKSTLKSVDKHVIIVNNIFLIYIFSCLLPRNKVFFFQHVSGTPNVDAPLLKLETNSQIQYQGREQRYWRFQKEKFFVFKNILNHFNCFFSKYIVITVAIDSLCFVRLFFKLYSRLKNRKSQESSFVYKKKKKNQTCN